jgi:hypothetical protein
VRVALALVLSLAAGAWAQPPQPDVDPSSITGRDFAGLILPMAPARGPIEIAGRKAWIWSDGTTRRVLAVGDVEVKLGLYQFSAARAQLWIQELDAGKGAGANDSRTYQVFAFFDRVGGAAEAAGATRISGDRLPVRGVLVPPEGLRLRCDVAIQDLPGREELAFVVEGERAFAGSLRRLLPGYVPPKPDDPFADLPQTNVPDSIKRLAGPTIPGTGRPFNRSPRLDDLAAAEAAIKDANVAPSGEPIFAKSGLLMVSAGERVVVSGAEKNSVLFAGGMSVHYDDRESGRTLQLTAQRGVIFLAGKAEPADRTGVEFGQFRREDVQGIYLEGDVLATDGRYTMRGPQVYYDLARNKAVVLDAVFWTYDERRRLPLYVRADSIRQESTREFKASSARLSNSAFFEPEFSIGASSVTITRDETPPTEEERAQGEGPKTATTIDASDLTLRAGSVPFFYWPFYKGDPTQVPLRDLRFENSDGSGFAVRTRWNAAGLLGWDKPEWLSTDLNLDYFGERGVGLGAKATWNHAQRRGEFLVYGLPSDTGTDIFRSGLRTERDGVLRGILSGEQRWTLDKNWSLLAEGAYVSDEAFADVFFPNLATERRELANRVLLRRIDEESAFYAEIKGSLNDFVVADHVYETDGYVSQKLPEFSYFRVNDDLLPGVRSGMLSYASEYRAGYASLAFDETDASARGLSNSLAQRALGINADQSVGDRLRAIGLSEHGVWRLDSRHEFTATYREGPVTISPFGVVRGTFYDQNFAAYTAATGANDGQGIDHLRLWSGGGVRLSTQLQRVNDSVDSRLFDLHRTRHIIEPSVTLFAAGTNVEARSLPVLDDEVENLLDGGMVRLGINQVWQTQRGGPGRWHSVDVLTLNTDVVFSTQDTRQADDGASPIGRFFDPRPELSNAGDYVSVDATWQASDTLAFSAASVFDLDLHQQAASSGGVLLRHAPNFASYVDAHYVNSQDQTILNAGTQYELSTKYTVGINAAYDATRNGFQGASFSVNRRFESVLFGVNASYDDISGNTSFGFLLQPFGARAGASIGGFGGGNVGSRFGG